MRNTDQVFNQDFAKRKGKGLELEAKVCLRVTEDGLGCNFCDFREKNCPFSVTLHV